MGLYPGVTPQQLFSVFEGAPDKPIQSLLESFPEQMKAFQSNLINKRKTRYRNGSGQINNWNLTSLIIERIRNLYYFSIVVGIPDIEFYLALSRILYRVQFKTGITIHRIPFVVATGIVP